MLVPAAVGLARIDQLHGLIYVRPSRSFWIHHLMLVRPTARPVHVDAMPLPCPPVSL